MHLVYVDDSKDERFACFSALIVPAHAWNACISRLIDTRRALWLSDGIFRSKEVHATEWLGGRGRLAEAEIGKFRRAMLYRYLLSVLRGLPGIRLMNAAAPAAEEEQVFTRLLVALDRDMARADSRCILFCDQGKDYNSLLRRIRRFRAAPSEADEFQPGAAERIIEDIVYRDSAHSFLIQMADCCAFALLRMLSPTARSRQYHFDNAFLDLEGVLVRAANPEDPLRLGIIR